MRLTRALLCLSLAVPAAQAGTIVSTLGPGGAFDHYSSWMIGSLFYIHVVTDTEIATNFTPGADYLLESISVAVQRLSTMDHPLILHVATGASYPETILETLIIPSLPTTAQLETAASVEHPLLQAGTLYWLYLSLDDLKNNLVDWSANTIGVPGVVVRTISYDWTYNGMPAPAFVVEGTEVVPEPGTLGLSLLGWALVARFARSRCR